jgi:hypothetical protein
MSPSGIILSPYEMLAEGAESWPGAASEAFAGRMARGAMLDEAVK